MERSYRSTNKDTKVELSFLSWPPSLQTFLSWPPSFQTFLEAVTILWAYPVKNSSGIIENHNSDVSNISAADQDRKAGSYILSLPPRLKKNKDAESAVSMRKVIVDNKIVDA